MDGPTGGVIFNLVLYLFYLFNDFYDLFHLGNKFLFSISCGTVTEVNPRDKGDRSSGLWGGVNGVTYWVVTYHGNLRYETCPTIYGGNRGRRGGVRGCTGY